MGRMKPMPELVVAPKIVIASPMFGIASDKMKLIRIMIKVANAFCFVENFYSGARKSSSSVSLQGRMVSGVAKRITVRIPKREM